MKTGAAPIGRHVALIRGINVGRAKRIAMGDLRELIEQLGYADVRTLLNSGNVVFSAPHLPAIHAADRIEMAIRTRLGIAARVVVMSARELAAIIAENPLGGVATDPSRLLVNILFDPTDRARLEPLADQRWDPSALALGARAAYAWCPDGALQSQLPVAIGRVLGDAVTSRNWATITKLHALAGDR